MRRVKPAPLDPEQVRQVLEEGARRYASPQGWLWGQKPTLLYHLFFRGSMFTECGGYTSDCNPAQVDPPHPDYMCGVCQMNFRGRVISSRVYPVKAE